MKSKTVGSVTVNVNVGKDGKKKPTKRRASRKRKPVVLAPGQIAPLRSIYDNANERAVHFSNFPAQRVIHETPPPATTTPAPAPVQQYFMQPPSIQQSPMVNATGVQDVFGSPIPRPNFSIARTMTTAPPQTPGLGAARPHSPEAGYAEGLERAPPAAERPARARGGAGGLRTTTKPKLNPIYSPDPWK